MATLAALLAVASLSPAPTLQAGSVFSRPPHAVYLERTSVVAGDTVQVFARSDAEKATVDVVAWAGGRRLLKPREVEIEPQHDLPNEATGGCRWSACATLAIPADTVSDVYVVRVRAENGETATAPLVVRAAHPGARSRTLVLYPEAALAATNEWGGASLFTTSYGPPASVVALARPLFGDRLAPVVNRAFLGWLGSIGFAVEHATDLDLERDEALLDAYDLVLFPHRHPYFTTRMRASVDAFVRNGGNVLILTGGFAALHARLENQGAALRAHGLPELDAAFPNPRVDREIAGPFALGPVNDPEERSFGLASRHAFYGLPRASGFGYLRARSPYHPFLRNVPLELDLFGRRDLGERVLVGVAGACDGANVEMLDGQVVASRVDGAPDNLRILATSPAQAGFAAVAEFHRFGSVAHFGSEAVAREPIGNGRMQLPDVLTMLANALTEYAPPRRSLVQNGGFERWKTAGNANFPLGFETQGLLEPLELTDGGRALGGAGGRSASAWQAVHLPDGDVHLLAWTRRGGVSLDVGNGFRLADAQPAGSSEQSAARGGYVYARARVESDDDRGRDAFVTCRLPERADAVVDLLEVIPETAWRRSLALDWRVPALGAGESTTSDPIAIDGGSAYLITFTGFGSGRLALVAPGEEAPLLNVTPVDRPGELGVAVVRPQHPGETVFRSLKLSTLEHLTDVEVCLLPLQAPSFLDRRAEPQHFDSSRGWTLPAGADWNSVPGVAGRGVRLSDERISIEARSRAEPGRITLWTLGAGTLRMILTNPDGSVLDWEELHGDPVRWTPQLVRVPALREAEAILHLQAVGEVQVDELRFDAWRGALRDDHVSNGGFEMAPSPAEIQLAGPEWQEHLPGWSVENGALTLDPTKPKSGLYGLRIEPRGGRAKALLRVPDPLPLERAWRVTLSGLCEPGARGEVALFASWPGDERRMELARVPLAERAWADLSLGATVALLEDAMDSLGAPHRRGGTTALAWIEVTASDGSVWIDDLTLDAD